MKRLPRHAFRKDEQLGSIYLRLRGGLQSLVRR